MVINEESPGEELLRRDGTHNASAHSPGLIADRHIKKKKKIIIQHWLVQFNN